MDSWLVAFVTLAQLLVTARRLMLQSAATVVHSAVWLLGCGCWTDDQSPRVGLVHGRRPPVRGDWDAISCIHRLGLSLFVFGRNQFVRQWLPCRKNVTWIELTDEGPKRLGLNSSQRWPFLTHQLHQRAVHTVNSHCTLHHVYKWPSTSALLYAQCKVTDQSHDSTCAASTTITSTQVHTFSTNVSLHLRNGARYGHSYYGSLIGNPIVLCRLVLFLVTLSEFLALDATTRLKTL